MRAAFASLLILASFAAAGPAAAIINGKPVSESDAYAHSVVGVVPIDQDGLPGECTGILLTPQAVLTAAHCVKEMKSVSVVFDLKIGDANTVPATRTVINPEYTEKEHDFSNGDLAVIFLPPHAYKTAVIPLDIDVDFTEGQQFIILGYGRSVAKRHRSNGLLRKAQIATTGYDTPREVELRPLGDAWPCDGDSGGPVLRKDMSGRYAVTGLMSVVYSGPVGECLTGSFMTPVHSYADWIAATLKQGG